MSPDSLGFFPLTIFIVIENSIVLNEQSRNPQAGFTLVDWRQKISGEAFLVKSVRHIFIAKPGTFSLKWSVKDVSVYREK